MGISTGRRRASLDRLCGFILWFPFDIPTLAMEKQPYARMDLCRLAEKVPAPVLFRDGK